MRHFMLEAGETHHHLSPRSYHLPLEEVNDACIRAASSRPPMAPQFQCRRLQDLSRQMANQKCKGFAHGSLASSTHRALPGRRVKQARTHGAGPSCEPTCAGTPSVQPILRGRMGEMEVEVFLPAHRGRRGALELRSDSKWSSAGSASRCAAPSQREVRRRCLSGARRRRTC